MVKGIKKLYDSGVELFDKGNYTEAEDLLMEVIRRSPGYADVHNRLGVISSLNGDLLKAAGFFRNALKLNPGYTEASLNLSITYNEMGEHEKAQQVFDHASRATLRSPGELDPFVAGKLANEHYKLGNMYVDFNLYDEAIDEYKKAVRLKPGLADIHTKLGVALVERGKVKEAISEFSAAKRANPYYGPAWVHLGLAYFRQGRKELAFREWEDALRKNPELKEARSFLNILRDKA
jgi:tetratricopeptide (TPR) repeat protein